MPKTRSQRGVTLIEAMVAMVVLLVGAIGMVSLHSTGVRIQGEAREITRATAIAQDLMNQIQTWEYADARLANANASNDADPSDDSSGTGTSPPPTRTARSSTRSATAAPTGCASP
jgi:type IV pilus modification protein PilV